VGDVRRGGQIGEWGPVPIVCPSPEIPAAPHGGVQSCRGAAGGGGNLSSPQLLVPLVYLLEAQEMISWVESLTLGRCSEMGVDVTFLTSAPWRLFTAFLIVFHEVLVRMTEPGSSCSNS